jgi:hypothetical protein
LLELLFTANQLINAVGERYFAEYGGLVVRVEAVLATFGALSLFYEADINELVEVVVKRAVVNVHFGFQFCRTHLSIVDKAVEDFVASPVSDGSMHCEVLLKTEDTVLWEEVRWILGEVPTD